MYMVGLLFKFTGMSEPIKSPRQLEVYKTALQAALVLSRIARRFPADERGLREQARRVGRAPGAAISEAYRKRTYPLIWKNKISEAQSEAGEAQWWLDVALTEGYCTQKEFDECDNIFEKLIAQLSIMFGDPKPWIIPSKPRGRHS